MGILGLGFKELCSFGEIDCFDGVWYCGGLVYVFLGMVNDGVDCIFFGLCEENLFFLLFMWGFSKILNGDKNELSVEL